MTSFNHFSSAPSPLSIIAMEDWNVLAADCVVISCCCQCLILQIFIFFLLKLPCKLIRKAKEYCNKLRHGRKRGTIIKMVKGRYQDEFWNFHGANSELSIQVERFPVNGDLGFRCCLEEVDKVLEEFSQKGEFAFGSFWGRERSRSSSTSVAEQKFDISVVQFEFVEVVASLSCSLNG